ncbi:MAG: hypothetical protein LBN21_00835, partial [Treponema sp.]|nr:hypothetical protein [Treponema sp.]
LTFSGKVASGVFFDSDDVPKENPSIQQPINPNYIGEDGRVRLWNDTDTDTGLRADLTASYTYENIGFRIRLRSDYDPASASVADANRITVGRYAYGWVNLFNEGLKLTGGFIDLSDNVWGTLGDGDWDIGGDGVRLEIKPFKFFKTLDEDAVGSLNIGAFLRIPAKENPNRGRDDTGKTVYRTVDFQRTLQETVFGFRYIHPWFYASLQLELDSDIDGVDIFEGSGGQILSDWKVWSSAGDETRLMFGAGFTLLPALVVTAEGNIEGLGNWEARGKADLRQTASYTLFDTLTLGMKAQELIWGYDLEKHADLPFELTPWMQFKPFVNYRIIPAFTAGLEGGFGSGHLVTGLLASKTSNTNDQNNKDLFFVNEKYNYYIKPNLAYKFAGGLEVTAWYKATFIGYADLGDDPTLADRRRSTIPFTDDGMTLIDSMIQHQVALEFIWTF